MKYTNKKKLVAMMALLIVVASFSGCNSANTAVMISSEASSSEIVISVPAVSSEEASSEVTSFEESSSAPTSSEAEDVESEVTSSEATTSSAAEVSSKTEAPAVSSEPTVSSAPTVTSEPPATSQATSSTVSSAPVESAAQTSSAPPVQTVSAPTQQQTGTAKAFEDMTEEEQQQWMLDRVNEQLSNITVHHLGTEKSQVESNPPTGDAGDDAERKALEKEKLEQLRQSLQEAQNKQKPDASQVDEQEPESDPVEEQETVSEATGDVYEAIRLINKERVKAGLSELTIDDTMMEMAAVRAQEIAIKYEHVRPDGSDWSTVFQEFGYKHGRIVENIYVSPDTASSAVNGWMGSPGHKANILNGDITHIGVGYYYDSRSEFYHHWVMLGAK